MSIESVRQAARRADWVDRILVIACVLLFVFCVIGLVVCLWAKPEHWITSAITFAASGGACVFNTLSVWVRVR